MTTRRRPRLLGSLAALAIVAAACGGAGDDASSGGTDATDGTEGGGGGGTLRTAFFADMQVPDPDIFYEVEGNQVVMSTYEGLLRYDQEGTNEIEPLLAESYEVSPDGLTYTFTLKEGVTFVDGTTFEADDAVYSFERRLGVDNAPAYMLVDLASTAAPDPRTFVVTLERPVSAFLDYMASPYGPKMVSPELIRENEVDGDWAQDWVRENSAGTGPYAISEFTLGQRYVLDAVEGYWGGAPAISTIEISIVPDPSTQVLQLESGDLDIVHGHPITTVNSFRDREGFQVIENSAYQKTQIKVNDNRPPFDDQALRTAMRSAIDREALVEEIFGSSATVSTSMLPAGMLPEGLAGDDYEVDTAPLEAAVEALAADERSITLAYSNLGANDGRLSEAIADVLTDAGFDVTIEQITAAVVFDLRNTPDQAPDLLVETANPDAAHPDTWARIFYSTEGFLNYLIGGDPAADAAMDRGLYAVDEAEVDAAYGEAGDILFEGATFITVADPNATFIAREGLGGFGSVSSAPLSLNVSTATDGG